MVARRTQGRGRRPAAVLAALVALGVGWPALAGGTRCWIDKGALVAPASFGDIAGDFLIDLSAPASALHVTRAELDGLEGGSATRDLVIAGRRIPALKMVIADLDSRTAAHDTVINGVLGADVLGRFTVEIDPWPCRLRLLPIGRRGPWAGGIRLPVAHGVGGRALAPAMISDGLNVRGGVFALGTADWPTTIVRARLSREPSPRAPARVRLRALEVGGRLFEQSPAALAQPRGDQAEGAIGMSVWSRWRLRLDVADGWLDLATARAR